MTPLVEHTKPTYTQYPTSEGTTETTFVNSTFDVPQPQNGGEGNPPEPAKKYTKEDFKQDVLTKIQAEIDSKYLQDFDLSNKSKFEALLKAFIKDPQKLDEIIAANDTEGIANEINRIVTDIKTALHTGWELQKIVNQQNNVNKRGLSETLGEFNIEIRNKGFANVDKATQERAIKAFFQTFFIDKEKELGHDKVVELQLKSFGRILINSSEEEKAAFKEVIKNLLSENIAPGLIEALESMDSPEELARSFNAEDTMEIYKTADQLGNYITEEDLETFVSTLTQYKDKDSITSDHEIYEQDLINFLNDNRDILETIKAKIEEGTALTEDEEAILKELNYKKSIASGEITGTAGNKYLEESEIKEVLTILNTDNLAHGDDFYRDVIEMAHNYVQNHEEELNITTGDFDGLMDETSESKYSELLPPLAANGDINTGSAYDHDYGGFVTISPEAVIYAQNNLSYLQEQIQNTSEGEENPQPQLVSDSGAETQSLSKPTIINNYEELTKYLANSADAVYSIVTGSVKLANNTLKSVVLDTYQTFSSRYKGTLLCQASDQWFGDIKGATKNLCTIVRKTLASGDKGNCFNRTQALEEIIEDNKKREENIINPPTLHQA